MQELVRETLGAWRDAERLAAACDPRSERYVVLMNAASQLRAIYGHLTHSVVGQDELDTCVAVLARLKDLIHGARSHPAVAGESA